MEGSPPQKIDAPPVVLRSYRGDELPALLEAATASLEAPTTVVTLGFGGSTRTRIVRLRPPVSGKVLSRRRLRLRHLGRYGLAARRRGGLRGETMQTLDRAIMPASETMDVCGQVQFTELKNPSTQVRTGQR
jgi:hypothetical protein